MRACLHFRLEGGVYITYNETGCSSALIQLMGRRRRPHRDGLRHFYRATVHMSRAARHREVRGRDSNGRDASGWVVLFGGACVRRFALTTSALLFAITLGVRAEGGSKSPVQRDTLRSSDPRGTSVRAAGELTSRVRAAETVTRPMCGSEPASISRERIETYQARYLEMRTALEAGGAAAGRVAGTETRFDLDLVLSEVPPEALFAVARVEQYVEAQFSDPITVQLLVSFAPMDAGLLGLTNTEFVQESWPAVRDAMQADADDDDGLLQHLPTGFTVPVRYNGSLDTVTNENTVFVTRANYLAAIGSAPITGGGLMFNSNVDWNYEPGSPGPGTFDFASVLAHEIAHALGFNSGADRGSDIETMDLFRFQRSDGSGNYNPDTFAEFRTTPRLVDENAPGTDNDVNSDLIDVEFRMSDGSPFQASHFAEESPGTNLMDPRFDLEETFHPEYYRFGDIAMLDIIGFDYPAQNTNCFDAVEIFPGEVLPFTNRESAESANPPLSCGTGGQHTASMWFSFVANDTSAEISTCGSLIGQDSSFAVYAGTCGALLELACSEDGPCGGNGTVCVDGLTPGETYYVQVLARTPDDIGAYALNLTSPCPGACCLAPPQSCSDRTPADCAALGGTFAGPGTACSVDGNEDVVADACQPPSPTVQQLPASGTSLNPSNYDASDGVENLAFADDFISDGRPIDAVKWWGATLDAGPEPDGFLVSFYEPLEALDPSVAPIGVYFCAAHAVDRTTTNIAACAGGPAVDAYAIDLPDCCLVQALPDSRSGLTPATANSFEAEECAAYDLSIQAVVGAVYEPGELDPAVCEEVLTAGSASGDFWGWYTSTDENGQRVALAGELTVGDPNLLGGPWQSPPPACTARQLAFELYSRTAVGSGDLPVWDNGPATAMPAMLSQFGGSAVDAMTADDFSLAEPAAITSAAWTAEEDLGFVWDGRVRVEVYPDDGAGAPDESGGPAVSGWIPDNFGTVARAELSPGEFRYEVRDIDVALAAGDWWIGLAPGAAPESTGETHVRAARVQTTETPLFGAEAHLRHPDQAITTFVPWSSVLMLGEMLDASFELRTTPLIDCNCNGVPDAEDLLLETSLDCNANDTPDECEPDCNRNGTPDDCDIANLASDDCQPNGIPDECDLLLGDGTDNNGNAVPDECECGDVAGVVRLDSGIEYNRYLRIDPGNAGRHVAIRVIPLDLGTLNGRPEMFGAFRGEPRWVGDPLTLESGETGALLTCEPICRDWTGVSELNIFGPAVVPESAYRIDVANCTCDPGDVRNYVAPVEVTTPFWADIVFPFDEDDITAQPDINDILAVVDAFLGTGLGQPRAQLSPDLLDYDFGVKLGDILDCVDSFLGKSYPYGGPCACPPSVTCGIGCVTDGECGEGNLCRSGQCVDRCGRCDGP